MGLIRKGIGYVNDDLALDIFREWWEYPFSGSFTCRGLLVDPEKYEIKPREEYRQKLIDAKQKEIEKVDEHKRRLEDELKELKKGI